MIIKSSIRGGYRSAAEYLKEQGQNEKTRLVEISDPSAKNLDEAFHNMWVVACNTKCTKPLHHISINPMKDERLTDAQVLAIVQRCEEKYGYKMFHHQRVIVEHIKDGRQHFHVIWNRVSLSTGRPVWPGEHWNKSKQVCREMEKELGLKQLSPKWTKRPRYTSNGGYRIRKGKRAPPAKGFRPSRNPKTKRQSYAKHASTKSLKRSRTQLGRSKSTLKRMIKNRSRGNRSIIRNQKSYQPISGFISINRIQHTTGRYDALNPIKASSFNPIIIKTPYIKPVMGAEPQPVAPYHPIRKNTGWPEAAVLDWAIWGCRNPQRFFTLWPELSI